MEPSPQASSQNPFSSQHAARLYAAGRPFHHRRALHRIMSLPGVTRPLRALDVGCGTGLSTIALAEVADQVVAIDSVRAMLELATRIPSAQYVVASADQLPFEDSSFDAATVSSAVHWFDLQTFLHEIRRTLKPNAWLAIYDHYFRGQIKDDPAFADWVQGDYRVRYPAPPRGPKFDPRVLPDGFELIDDDAYEDPIAFTHTQLVNYLLTQSNCIAALEDGRESEDGLRRSLTLETARFFQPVPATRTVEFYGVIHVLRRDGAG